MNSSSAVAIICVIMCCTLPAFGDSAKVQPSPAQFSVSPPEINFGTWKASDIVSPEFTGTVRIKNTSQTLMEIVDVRADCSCTMPKLSHMRLDPGGETEMTVGLKLAGIAGHKTSHVIVRLNDGQIIPVPVRIIIVEKIQASVESIKLSVSRGEMASTDVLVVKPIDAIPETQDSVTVVADHGAVSVAKLESVALANASSKNCQTRATLRFRLNELDLGRYRGTIRAKFAQGGQIDIPYDIEVKSAVRIERVFPPVIDESTKTVSLLIFHPRTSFSIDSIKLDGKNCVFAVNRNDQTSVVEVTIPKSSQRRDLSGMAVLLLNGSVFSLPFKTTFLK